MRHYTHFTTEVRELSRVLLAQDFSLRAIARKLNRSPSSVCRELARNSKTDGTYSANHADKLYQKRRRNCSRNLKTLWRILNTQLSFLRCAAAAASLRYF